MRRDISWLETSHEEIWVIEIMPREPFRMDANCIKNSLVENDMVAKPRLDVHGRVQCVSSLEVFFEPILVFHVVMRHQNWRSEISGCWRS